MVLFKYKSGHLIPFLQTTSGSSLPLDLSQSPFSGLQGPTWHGSGDLFRVIPSCSLYPHLAHPQRWHQPLAILRALLHTLTLETLLWFFPLPGTHSPRYWQDWIPHPLQVSVQSSTFVTLTPWNAAAHHLPLLSSSNPPLCSPVSNTALISFWHTVYFPSWTCLLFTGYLPLLKQKLC